MRARSAALTLAVAGALSAAGSVGVVTCAAGARTTAAAAASNGDAQTRNAGTIAGRITAVDYSTSTMTVSAGARNVSVHVLPSTNIRGPGNAFHTIADIKKGERVRVMLSQTGSIYNAQLITLLRQ